MYTVDRQNGDVVYRDQVENVQLKIPAASYLGLLQINDPPPLQWPRDYQAAFRSPVGTPPLKKLAVKAKRVAIIVSDATRGVPTARILPFLMEELAAAGIREDQITVVIGTGVHRPATPGEIQEIMGDWKDRIRVKNHQADCKEELVYLGETTLGTPVEVNRTVYDCDLRIIVGKVEPHEFAGFSGGRKSILPGVAGRKTIEINHRPEMLLNPQSRPGVLEGNPIDRDMVEAAEMLGVDFTVNLVLDATGEITGLFTGGLTEGHREAVRFLSSFCRVELTARPDIIVTTPGLPLNIDFYQSIKPLIALEPLLTSGMAVVLYSACPDGVGSEEMHIPFQGAKTVEEMLAWIDKNNYSIQMDHALLLGKILQKGVKIFVSSPNVKKEYLQEILLEPAATPAEALDKAISAVGKSSPGVLFFPQPQRGLPTFAL